MGKQNRSKKLPENLGKGKVTPVQVAFIVDRYLSDNKYSQTRSVFRAEASSLISKSPVREAPKTLLSLGTMLDEYVCLKEQKVMVEQERVRLEQEKIRVQSLLQGMQSVMNAYNASTIAPVPTIPHHANATKSVAVISRSNPCTGSSKGPSVSRTQTVIPISGPSSSEMERVNYSSLVTSQPLTRPKRSLEVVAETPAAAKKNRTKLDPITSTTQVAGTEKLPESGNGMNGKVPNQITSVNNSSPPNATADGSTMHVPSVAKCLFNQPRLSPPTNSSGPQTPSQADSPQNDTSMTPVSISLAANCSHSNTPQEITSSNCTIISTERVTVSPLKQMTCYTIERNHCISSRSPVKTCSKRLGKRDHVKSRLDFGGSDVIVDMDKPTTINETSTSESEMNADFFDLDFPDFDAFGADFSFSELLVDLDLGCEGMDPCQPTLGTSADALSGSSHESGDGNLGANQVMSEISSTVTEVFSEKDMNAQYEPDTVTSVKSITKCIKILSPAKGGRNSSKQQICFATN